MNRGDGGGGDDCEQWWCLLWWWCITVGLMVAKMVVDPLAMVMLR